MEFDTNSKKINIKSNQRGRVTLLLLPTTLDFMKSIKRFGHVLNNVFTSFSPFPSNCVCISLCLFLCAKKRSKKPEIREENYSKNKKRNGFIK